MLRDSLAHRDPRYDPKTSRSVRVGGLENHLLLSACVQADLHEERIAWERELWELDQRWAHVRDWEHNLVGRTEKAIIAAKAQAAPELYAKKRGAEWIVKLLTQEIDRMESDATKVSRAMTAELNA